MKTRISYLVLCAVSSLLFLKPAHAQLSCATGQFANATLINVGLQCSPVPSSYLRGTTGTITGTLLAIGGQDSGTVTVTGATPGMPCIVSTTDGSNPGSAVTVNCSVTAADTVTVYLTAFVLATPASKAYNVRIFP